ncbi:Homeobox protein Hox-D3 [Acipenser ruthenus]|uniref:Homeobox protein Hox-D3 n=1 Tax=Acipenser ruthenus TaxID=7906 RepID=A0A444U5D2_ACIRT|nr:Homeobox protein Hox-D3 [Acipenser ruthenus]
MQKAAYYDNSGLFGGYSYTKSDAYSYNSAHQPYPPSTIENDFQSSVCTGTIQTPTIRPPSHKSSDINGSCMRTSGNQGSSQPANISEQQQAPPLPASSPNSSSTSTQKKKSASTSSVNSTSPVITKQIFPWMKESRQNSKQKSNCTAAQDRSPPLSGPNHIGYSSQIPNVNSLNYDAHSPTSFAKPHQNMYGLAAYTAPLGSCLPQQKRYPGSEYEHHTMQGNGGFANPNLQGSPVYVGGNFVDSMPASGPMFNLGHLPHPSSASVDYSCAAQIPGNHHHGPCDPHPTYTDLTSHHTSQGRIQEAPKLTHL